MSLSPRSHADGGAAPEGCGSCWGSGWGEQDPPHVCRVSPPGLFPPALSHSTAALSHFSFR